MDAVLGAGSQDTLISFKDTLMLYSLNKTKTHISEGNGAVCRLVATTGTAIDSKVPWSMVSLPLLPRVVVAS